MRFSAVAAVPRRLYHTLMPHESEANGWKRRSAIFVWENEFPNETTRWSRKKTTLNQFFSISIGWVSWFDSLGWAVASSWFALIHDQQAKHRVAQKDATHFTGAVSQACAGCIYFMSVSMQPVSAVTKWAQSNLLTRTRALFARIAPDASTFFASEMSLLLFGGMNAGIVIVMNAIACEHSICGRQRRE